MARDWILATESVAVAVNPGDQITPAPITGPRQDDTAAMADVVLALRLLAGFAETEAGVPKTEYPTSAEDESRCRAALARLIRTGRLKGIPRELLALAIDPESKPSAAHMRPTVHVDFVHPGRRNKDTWARDRLVANFIKSWMHDKGRSGAPVKEEAARRAAEEHFGLGRSRVAEIWREHKQSG